MQSKKVLSVGGGLILAAALTAGYAENREFAASRQTLMGVSNPSNVVFAPAPIPAAWVLEGHPKTEASLIAHTDDGTTNVYVWKTTASRFNWFYDSDEVVTIVDGEVFIADGSKVERRLGPGDVAFFPAGATTTWRVPDHLRKIATLKRPLPGPVASVMRWWRAAKSWVKPSQAFAAS